MPPLLRRTLAEALGTFALVFVGVGSVSSKYFPDAGAGLMGVAVAHGLVLAIMVSATMGLSGGHLNPAVTLGLLATRRTRLGTAAAYIAGQLLGAVLAALLVRWVYPPGISHATSLGVPALGTNITFERGIVVEAVLTFLLMSAVYGTCVRANAPKIGGFGVGLVLVFAILVGGPLTGAALNPARAFGPALVAGQWVAHLVYWLGPVVGAVAAALTWEYILLAPEERGR